MGKTPKRNSNIVVKSQFNINGSRGKDVGSFIADYVARDAATDTSTAYIPPNDTPMVVGDGVAFTLDDLAITRDETLALAERVQQYHAQGNRAIQQMVVSFAPQYLVEQGLVPEGTSILAKGDYRHNYDDVRLRYAIQDGVAHMVENDKYRDANMVAAIQSDTLHLHAHIVVYEDAPDVARRRGKEERGMLKQSSLSRLVHRIDQSLDVSRDIAVVPTQRLLTPEYLDDERRYVMEDVSEHTRFVDNYLRLLEEQEREHVMRREREDDLAETIISQLDLLQSHMDDGVDIE